jgi:hypothetical protein
MALLVAKSGAGAMSMRAPWPSLRTRGVPAIVAFALFTGSKRMSDPAFSVTSILPSGRNAKAQGDEKLASAVRLNGCASPASFAATS